MAIPILLTISMHIKLIRFLEVGYFNAKYNLKKRLYEECTGTNWVDDGEIKETMAMDNNKDDDKKDL